jgi:DNA repair protein RecO (recombination protein O)
VGALARGVRRPRSKLAPALELFARIDVLLARGRNLDIVTQATRVGGPRLAADVERTAHAGLIAELAERVTGDRHPLEGIYELTAGALDELARESDPRRASAYFLVAALDQLGYALQLAGCVSCEQALPAQPAAFSAPNGGFLCAGCALPGMIPTSVGALKVLRLMAAGDRDTYQRLRLRPDLLAEVEGVLETQLEHHLDRRLKSLQFLRQMRVSA